MAKEMDWDFGGDVLRDIKSLLSDIPNVDHKKTSNKKGKVTVEYDSVITQQVNGTEDVNKLTNALENLSNQQERVIKNTTKLKHNKIEYISADQADGIERIAEAFGKLNNKKGGQSGFIRAMNAYEAQFGNFIGVAEEFQKKYQEIIDNTFDKTGRKKYSDDAGYLYSTKRIKADFDELRKTEAFETARLNREREVQAKKQNKQRTELLRQQKAERRAAIDNDRDEIKRINNSDVDFSSLLGDDSKIEARAKELERKLREAYQRLYNIDAEGKRQRTDKSFTNKQARDFVESFNELDEYVKRAEKSGATIGVKIKSIYKDVADNINSFSSSVLSGEDIRVFSRNGINAAIDAINSASNAIRNGQTDALRKNIRENQEFIESNTRKYKPRGQKGEVLTDGASETENQQKEFENIGRAGEQAAERIRRSQEEIQKEIEQTNKVIKIQEEWMKHLAFLDADYSTSGKREANHQLMVATERLRDARIDPKRYEHIDSYTEKTKYMWFKAYQEAQKQGSSDTILDRYHTDVTEAVFNDIDKEFRKSLELHKNMLQEAKNDLVKLNAELADVVNMNQQRLVRVPKILDEMRNNPDLSFFGSDINSFMASYVEKLTAEGSDIDAVFDEFKEKVAKKKKEVLDAAYRQEHINDQIGIFEEFLRGFAKTEDELATLVARFQNSIQRIRREESNVGDEIAKVRAELESGEEITRSTEEKVAAESQLSNTSVDQQIRKNTEAFQDEGRAARESADAIEELVDAERSVSSSALQERQRGINSERSEFDDYLKSISNTPEELSDNYLKYEDSIRNISQGTSTAAKEIDKIKAAHEQAAKAADEHTEAEEHVAESLEREYKYGMRLRGFSPGAQPKEGLIRSEEGNNGYYNYLVYNRELTKEEIEHYSLDAFDEAGNVIGNLTQRLAEFKAMMKDIQVPPELKGELNTVLDGIREGSISAAEAFEYLNGKIEEFNKNKRKPQGANSSFLETSADLGKARKEAEETYEAVEKILSIRYLNPFGGRGKMNLDLSKLLPATQKDFKVLNETIQNQATLEERDASYKILDDYINERRRLLSAALKMKRPGSKITAEEEPYITGALKEYGGLTEKKIETMLNKFNGYSKILFEQLSPRSKFDSDEIKGIRADILDQIKSGALGAIEAVDLLETKIREINLESLKLKEEAVLSQPLDSDSAIIQWINGLEEVQEQADKTRDALNKALESSRRMNEAGSSLETLAAIMSTDTSAEMHNKPFYFTDPVEMHNKPVDSTEPLKYFEKVDLNNVSLKEKLDLLKELKKESKFLETAEDKRIDMEEKAWDAGGNNTKSEAESLRKIAQYEALVEHIQKAEDKISEFEGTYEKVIIELKSGEKIDFSEVADLSEIKLDKSKIKDILFVPLQEELENENIIKDIPQQLDVVEQKIVSVGNAAEKTGQQMVDNVVQDSSVLSNTDNLNENSNAINKNTEEVRENIAAREKLNNVIGTNAIFVDEDLKGGTYTTRENVGRTTVHSRRLLVDEEGNPIPDANGNPAYELTDVRKTNYEQIVKSAIKAKQDLQKAIHDYEIEANKTDASSDNLDQFITQIAEAKRRLDEATESAKLFAKEQEEFINDENYNSKYFMDMFNEAVDTGSERGIAKENIRYNNAMKRASDLIQKAIDKSEREISNRRIKLSNLRYTYDQGVAPGVSKPVYDAKDLAELSALEGQISGKLSSLNGRTATQKELIEIDALIAEYKNLIKVKKDANNPTKREMGGQRLQVAVTQELAKYDKAIYKSEQLGEASRDVTEALRAQRAALAENADDVDAYYNAQNIRKYNEARLETIKVNNQRAETSEASKAGAQAEETNRVNALLEEQKNVYMDLLLLQERINTTSEDNSGSLKATKQILQERYLALEKELKLHENILSVEQRRAVLSEAKQSYEDRIATLRNEDEAKARDAEDKAREKEYQETLKRLKKEGEAQERQILEEAQAYERASELAERDQNVSESRIRDAEDQAREREYQATLKRLKKEGEDQEKQILEERKNYENVWSSAEDSLYEDLRAAYSNAAEQQNKLAQPGHSEFFKAHTEEQMYKYLTEAESIENRIIALVGDETSARERLNNVTQKYADSIKDIEINALEKALSHIKDSLGKGQMTDQLSSEFVNLRKSVVDFQNDLDRLSPNEAIQRFRELRAAIDDAFAKERLPEYKKSNNKQGLEGPKLETAVTEELSKYDRAIYKSEQLGEASREVTEALKAQRAELAKSANDADAYYNAQNVRKYNEARLETIKVNKYRDEGTEERKAKAQAEEVNRVNSLLEEQKAVYLDLLSIQERINNTSDEKSGSLRSAKKVLQERYLALEKELKLHEDILSVEQRRAALSDAKQSYSATDIVSSNQSEARIRDAEDKAREREYQETAKRLRKEGEEQERQVLKEIEDYKKVWADNEETLFNGLKTAYASIVSEQREMAKPQHDAFSRSESEAKITSYLEEAASIETKLVALIGDEATARERLANITNDYTGALRKIELKSLSDAVKHINSSLGKGKLTEQLEGEFSNLRGMIEAFQNELDSLTPEEAIKKFNDLRLAIDKSFAKEPLAKYKKANESTISSIGMQIERYMADNTGMGSEFMARFEKLRTQYDAAESIADVNNLKKAFFDLRAEVDRAGVAGKGFFDTVKERAMSSTAQFISTYFSLQDWIRYGREAFDIIRELDYALVDLKKTSSMTGAEMDDFYFSANDVAKQMGVTTQQIIEQASNWSRLGLHKIDLLYGNI